MQDALGRIAQVKTSGLYCITREYNNILGSWYPPINAIIIY